VEEAQEAEDQVSEGCKRGHQGWMIMEVIWVEDDQVEELMENLT